MLFFSVGADRVMCQCYPISRVGKQHSIHDCWENLPGPQTSVTRALNPQSVEYTTTGENSWVVKLGWSEALCCVLEDESTRAGGWIREGKR